MIGCFRVGEKLADTSQSCGANDKAARVQYHVDLEAGAD